jgi:glycosyltransferase 2 family protein
MNRKRLVILLAVVAVLGVLIYLQFREWQRFDWATFARVTGHINKIKIAWAVAIIYVTYVLRAVRWKVFLRPVCRARMATMIPPQFIGFTGLALLGRPGELIRPYLIAKKEDLTFSSQVAVWAVERIFDIGAFAILMAIDVFFFARDFNLDTAITSKLRIGGGVLILLVAGMALGAWAIRRNSHGVADWLERRISGVSKKAAGAVCHKIRAFGEGLNTIHDTSSFMQLVGVSLAIWFLIAVAYREVLHSYPLLTGDETARIALHHMNVPHVLLLMGASMIGSLLQLPAVGGGSQLATISVLSSPAIFAVPREQAVSAGMMLWLVTFIACIPVGLFFAHREHVSLRKISEETNLEEQEQEDLKSSPAGPVKSA